MPSIFEWLRFIVVFRKQQAIIKPGVVVLMTARVNLEADRYCPQFLMKSLYRAPLNSQLGHIDSKLCMNQILL